MKLPKQWVRSWETKKEKKKKTWVISEERRKTNTGGRRKGEIEITSMGRGMAWENGSIKDPLECHEFKIRLISMTVSCSPALFSNRCKELSDSWTSQGVVSPRGWAEGRRTRNWDSRAVSGHRLEVQKSVLLSVWSAFASCISRLWVRHIYFGILWTDALLSRSVLPHLVNILSSEVCLFDANLDTPVSFDYCLHAIPFPILLSF